LPDVETRAILGRLTIRGAKESDLEGMRVLYQHLNPSDPLLATAKLRDAWQALLGNPAFHCLVVEVDGQIVSTCTVVFVPNLTRSARPYGFVENVVTHEEHRRKGLGTAILKAALDLAWRHGCYKVMLMTGSTKEGTLRFYERAGFRRGEKTAFVARPG
jgi:GNAT superfamily N-acetyltransferase